VYNPAISIGSSLAGLRTKLPFYALKVKTSYVLHTLLKAKINLPATLFSTLGPSSLPDVVAQPERHANRTASVLEWYDRHRT